jgi:hypothetical protein
LSLKANSLAGETNGRFVRSGSLTRDLKSSLASFSLMKDGVAPAPMSAATMEPAEVPATSLKLTPRLTASS